MPGLRYRAWRRGGGRDCFGPVDQWPGIDDLWADVGAGCGGKGRGGAAAEGATDVAVSLLRSPASQAWASSPLKVGGLAVGAFATGYVIGTGGRALAVTLFGGSGPDHGGVSPDVPWSNVRWRLCTQSPSCVTIVNSSAWESAVIPTGRVYATFDSTWTNQNFSVPGVWGYVNCYGATPPASPCTPYYHGASGPQAGDVPGATAITVYGFGISPRPGYVFVQTLRQLLDRDKANAVIDAGQVSGSQFGSVSSYAPPKDEALGAIDEAIADNADFAGFVEGLIQAHWPTIADCDSLTQAACVAAVRAAGFLGPITGRTLSASEAVMARDPNKVTGTFPSGLAKADPGIAITIYVNPATKPALTLQQTLIANALRETTRVSSPTTTRKTSRGRARSGSRRRPATERSWTAPRPVFRSTSSDANGRRPQTTPSRRRSPTRRGCC